MPQELVTCPHCRREFELSAAMSTAIEAKLRAGLEAEAAKLRADAERRKADDDRRRADLEARERTLAQRAADADQEVAKRLAAERAKLADQLRKQAAEEQAASLAALREDLQRSREKLDLAQQAELALRRDKQALEDAKRSFELDKQRAIDAERAKIIEKTQRDAAEDFRLKSAEKDKLIADMQKQVDELKRKSEQGSQQLQGEVLELDLEAALKAAFPRDLIEPVAKGVFGGDVLHRVTGPGGAVVGTILWESKRTKAWSDGWLTKLRADQREAKAEVAALMSTTLPKGVDHFSQIDGVWVCGQGLSIPLASVLRAGLLEVAAARASREGMQSKMELVYHYLTGPHFVQRVSAILEAFASMREDLDAEKKALQKQWAKREKQIETVLASTASLYGDVQGIAGKSVPEIEGLEMKSLGEPARPQ